MSNVKDLFFKKPKNRALDLAIGLAIIWLVVGRFESEEEKQERFRVESLKQNLLEGS